MSTMNNDSITFSNKQEIGSRIKELRANRHLSQAALASLVDISTSYMSNIETGKCNPSSSILSRLADSLNVSSDYLLYGSTFSAALTDAEHKTIDICTSHIGQDYVYLLNSISQFLISRPKNEAKSICLYITKLVKLIIPEGDEM